MTELVVCLGSEKTDDYVRKLIEVEDWEKVIVVSDDKKRTFKPAKAAKIILINPEKKLSEIVQELSKSFSREAKGIEVAVNIVAAKGKTGMAVVAALLTIGKAIRLVAWSKEGLVVF